MSEYRTPEEDRLSAEQTDRIAAAIHQAVIDGGALMTAMVLAEPPEVVEAWVDRLWNGLRKGLRDGEKPRGVANATEDRLAAIVELLKPRMKAEAQKLLDTVGADQ